MSTLRLASMVSDVIVFADTKQVEQYLTSEAGAVCVDGVGRRAVIRRWAHPESGVGAYFEQRARLLATLDGCGAPRLFRTLASKGKLQLTVEEWLGPISLRQLLAELGASGRTPAGLALHVGRSLAAIWERLEQMATWPRLTLDPSKIWIGSDGRVRAEVEPYPGPREHNHGAAVALLDPNFELMSPEQVRGLPLTIQTPMFAVGLTMFECLRGEPNFTRTRPWELLQQIAHARFPPARELRPDVAPALLSLIDRCLLRTPEERFESWAELIAAFEDVRREAEIFGAAELNALQLKLFSAACAEEQVLADEIATLDFVRAAATLPQVAFEPWAGERLLLQRLPTPVEVASIELDVTEFGSDGRPMLAAVGLKVDLRPVTNAEYARFVIDTRARSPSHWGGPVPSTAIADEPVTRVGFGDAAAYARWAGKRIPSNAEWERLVRHLGPEVLGAGGLWEWTSTAAENGFIVRGGKWRNAHHLPASATHLSWEENPSADVGFRCVGHIGQRGP